MKTIKTIADLAAILFAADMFLAFTGLKDWHDLIGFTLAMLVGAIAEDRLDRKALTKLNSPDCQAEG